MRLTDALGCVELATELIGGIPKGFLERPCFFGGRLLGRHQDRVVFAVLIEPAVAKSTTKWGLLKFVKESP
jgi:hypothetical protein